MCSFVIRLVAGKKNGIQLSPSTARHFIIAVASFMRNLLDYSTPHSVGIISLATVSVAAGSSAVAAATKAFSYHGFFIARKHQIECMAHVRSK